jgi:hypothetical protein
VSWPTAFGYRAAGKRSPEIGRELGVDAIAVVWARAGSAAPQINIHMMDAARDSKMWVDSFAYAADQPSQAAQQLRQRLLQK